MSVLNEERKRNLAITRMLILGALDEMINDNMNNPRMKSLYISVKQNVLVLPINVRPGNVLEGGYGYATMGENVKRISASGAIQSAIFLPEEHLFDGDRISYDGLLTLLHEYSHVTLAPHAQMFANSLGLEGELTDEFFADTVAAKIAKKMHDLGN